MDIVLLWQWVGPKLEVALGMESMKKLDTAFMSGYLGWLAGPPKTRHVWEGCPPCQTVMGFPKNAGNL